MKRESGDGFLCYFGGVPNFSEELKERVVTEARVSPEGL